MSDRPFMQLYVSDFVGDTLHLSTEQIGAYMLLLMAMWNAGGSIPADDAKVARVVRMSVKKWRAIAPDLMPFFQTDGAAISHNRLTKELQKSARKSERRAASGAKGGTAKALKNNDAGLANGVAKSKHSPESREKEKRKSTPIPSKTDDVATPIADRVFVAETEPVFAVLRSMRLERGVQTPVQNGRWNFDRSEVDAAIERLGKGPPGMGVVVELERTGGRAN